MKPSYVICKYCFSIVWPDEVGLEIFPYPTGNEKDIETLKKEAKKQLVCCGANHFIRKVASKM